MIELENDQGTVGSPQRRDRLSSAQTLPYRKQRKYPARPSAPFPPQTSPVVEDAELGDEEERDWEEYSRPTHQENHQAAADETGEASRKRSELARDLLSRLKDLATLLGKVSLAANLELLKKDLARCHKELQAHASETNFLSIVTLVESAMTNLKWKQYSEAELDLFRKAFNVGYRKAHVRFQDYDEIRKQFSREQVRTLPQMDLASLKPEDLENDEEE
jgi:hypothetical protein